MIMDNGLVFSGNPGASPATGQAITSTAASTNVIDLTGVGSGNAPLNRIGNASVFGEDLGIGDGVNIPRVGVWVTAAFVSAGGATLQVQFQGSADSGSNTAAGYTTYIETDAMTVANLTIPASQAPGQVPEYGKIGFAWPHRAIAAAMPRFVRLNYVVGTSTFSAGAVAAAVVLGRDDWAAGLYAANYTVA